MDEEQIKALTQELNALGMPIDFTTQDQKSNYDRLVKEIDSGKKSLDISNIQKGIKNIDLLSKSGMNESNNLDFDSEEKMEGIADAFGVSRGEFKLGSDNNVADNTASITNTGNSNFKQTADMGSAFDSSSDSFDESEFSFLDGMQRKGDFKLNTRGDENEKSRSLSLLNNTNQNENALDVSYKNKAEQDVIKSTGKAVEERNFMSSKTRGGLFGNYGKQVKINKIVDPNTGKVNREKYVDGKLTKSTAEKDRFKREKKSGRETGRAKRKAGRNK